MKKLKKIISLLASAALLFMLPGAGTLTASAEEPVSYYVKYHTEDKEWRFQIGSAWDDQGAYRELYYMQQDIKDGDIVIIDGNGDLNITLNVRLSNLTLTNASTIVVGTNGIDSCYILGGSRAAVNGDITNAYVYDASSVTFNNNISTLQILGSSDINANVTAAGSVGHLIGRDNNTTYYDLYNIAQGKLVVENGSLKTSEEHYSTTPSSSGQTASQPVTQESASQTQPAQTQTTQASSSQTSGQASADEYDDVPKTGDSNLVLYLTVAGAVCLLASYALRKFPADSV